MSDDSVTPGGSRVHRYREEPHFQYADPSHAGGFPAEIETHLQRFLGRKEFVLHEIVSDQVHIDVLQFAPTRDRNYWTYVTSGMSDRPMKVPRDLPDWRNLERAELVISLPRDWNLTGRDEAVWWPINWLTYLARFPHKYDTWLWVGHSIPSGDPAEPVAASTKMTGFLLYPPVTWPDDAMFLVERHMPPITFLGVFPVYADEMAFKLENGSDALRDLFDAKGVTEILDPWRRPVVGAA